jgi:L-lactate dehydrogenase (cytochrome)
MKPREALNLIGFDPRQIRRIVAGREERQRHQLERCHQLADLRALAVRRTPEPVFDYVEGGADEELTLVRNIEAFRQWEFVPLGARDVSSINTRSVLLGREHSLPLLCSPTGYTRMIQHSGELAVARAAARAQLPYGLSTVASTSIEELATSAHPDLWFQLYIWRDRAMTRQLVERAWQAGYRVLEVSVDVAVSGFRGRDARNGLTIPPQLTSRTLASIALKPHYWLSMLSNPPIRFANSPPDIEHGGGITIENMSSQFDPTVDWEAIAEIRHSWPGPMLVKGAFGPEGAVAAVQAGADGVHLSNHGGRQLDRCVPPIDLVSGVRAAIGESATIIVDSGIRHGSDIAVAIALGADAAAIGRAYLYGLMAGGEAGVDRVLTLLDQQLCRTMALLGVTSVGELREYGPKLLRRRSESANSIASGY